MTGFRAFRQSLVHTGGGIQTKSGAPVGHRRIVPYSFSVEARATELAGAMCGLLTLLTLEIRIIQCFDIRNREAALRSVVAAL